MIDKENQSQERLLPGGEKLDIVPIELDVDGSLTPPNERKDKIRKIAALLIVALICLCTALALTGIFAPAEEVETVVGETQSEEQWRGAFLDRTVYEACIKSSAVIRLERGSGGVFWSGFVFAADGWIATSLEGLDRARSGRLYVILGDGREYLVESISVDRESSLALLKINADGLSAVSFREGSVDGGERVFSISATGDNLCSVSSGEIKLEKDGELRIGLYSGEGSVGAPIFDENGYLVAMMRDDRDSAVSAERSRKIFGAVKGSQN